MLTLDYIFGVYNNGLIWKYFIMFMTCFVFSFCEIYWFLVNYHYIGFLYFNDIFLLQCVYNSNFRLLIL